MSLHGDLLNQARQLARMDPKRPKQANLRRAVSAAYYALFHLLTSEAAGRMVRGRGRELLRLRLRRAFDHSAMKEACGGFASGNVPRKLRLVFADHSIQPELVSLAKSFVALQQARHEADYDASRFLTRKEVLELVGEAKEAMSCWKAVRNSPQADAFLVALLALRQIKA